MKKKTSVTTVEHSVAYGQSSAEQPRFTFTGKPGINVNLENPSNPLEYFWFCTAEIARDINRYAQKCLGNSRNLKQ
jgi:hypothetical protein